MISLDEALSRIISTTSPLDIEKTALAEVANRILAEPVISHMSQPPFNASAMDGYAVRAADIVPGATLTLVGTSQAGTRFDGTIEAGQCARIFTGAPMPKGADSVIMQEQAQADGDIISFEGQVSKGQHVRPKGQDFLQGNVLLKKGSVLNPASLALCAASNNAELAVFRQPTISILATGDELVPPGENPSPDQIISSNPYGLNALFSSLTPHITNHGIAPDDESKLTGMLRSILEGDADIIITTGGASVGDHDIVQPVLKSLGVKMDFWKIAMRPGKPLMFGTYGKKLVFGLPGNPVSAMITAIVAVLPALRAMSGMNDTEGKRLRLPLSAPIKANGPRRHFLRGRIETDETGSSKINPIGETDSANLSSLASANALIIHYENAPEIEADQLVDIILI